MEILLADDHVLFRDALIQFMAALKPDWNITVSDDFDFALECLDKSQKFDLVLLDLRMPGMNGLNGLETIRKQYPEQMIAILSGVAEEHHVKEAMAMGAQAYFPKTLSGKALIKAIEYIKASGQKFVPMADDGTKIMPAYFDDHGNYVITETPQTKVIPHKILDSLTKREAEVLTYLARGLSNKEIADEMGIQIATVKLHVSGVCKKLNADNRTQAAVLAHQYGLTT